MTQKSHLARRHFLTGAASILAVAMTASLPLPLSAKEFEVTKTDAEWKRILSPQAYKVLRHEDTEYPFTSPLDKEKGKGIFACAGCDLALFDSSTKFDSGTGWPSFWRPLPNAVGTTTDYKLLYPRTEVHCRRCGGHLGHVFDDGPKPTGKRYCMNGVAMKFKPA